MGCLQSKGNQENTIKIQGFEEIKILQQQKNSFKLRIINLPKEIQNYHFYAKQSLIVEKHQMNCYSINGEEIRYNCELTQSINDKCNKRRKDETLYLDNHLIVRSGQKVFKFNLDQQGKHEIFNSAALITLIEDIKDYKQINRKSFIAARWSEFSSRIILFKNLKVQNTILPFFSIDSTVYLNHIVSTISYQGVYFFNVQMTKQIRKYVGISNHYLHINANYLFVPAYIQIKGERLITNVKIYDIRNFKLKGTIEIKNRKEELYYFIFIKDLNILAAFYPNKLIDLYDCSTFEYQRSEKLNGDYQSQLKKDQENGLILFQMRNIYK